MTRLTNILTRLGGVGACVILIAIVAFILLEIVLRTLFGSSTYVLDEFVGYGVSTMTFLSFAMTLKDKVFIRVNLVLSQSGPVLRRWIEFISYLIGTVLFSFVGYYFWKIVWLDFSRGRVSNSIAEVPLWIPEFIMFVGLLVFVIQLAALTVKYLCGASVTNAHKEL